MTNSQVTTLYEKIAQLDRLIDRGKEEQRLEVNIVIFLHVHTA